MGQEFLSVPNMQRLISILVFHFRENVGIDIESLGVPLKQFMHRVMKGVSNDYRKTHSVNEMNKVAIKIAKDFLLKVAAVQESPRPRSPKSPPDPISEKAPTEEDLSEKMKQYVEQRESVAPPPFPQSMDVPIGDPYQDYLSAVSAATSKDGTACRVLNPSMSYLVDQNTGQEHEFESSTDLSALQMGTLIPRNEKKRLVTRYLMVNGFDRNTALYKSRFEFQVDLTPNDATFKDIRSIAAKQLIIPREIMEEKSVTNIPKTVFNHKFGLRHQYLILQVDDFQNVYRSPSTPSSRAFAHFVFDGLHETQFGRQYIYLKPMLGEEKRFDTNPHTQLATMSLSIRQPNGELLNKSLDDYRLFKLDYDETNSKHLNVRLGRYFDKNEFFVGDRVLFSGFKARYFIGPNPNDYYNHPRGAALEDFVNRPEGHDILEVIDATATGYYSSFYIQAPGEFDATTGKFMVDLDSVDGDPARVPTSVLYDLNQNINFPSSLSTIFEIGKVLNLSLQVSIGFSIVEEEDDVTV